MPTPAYTHYDSVNPLGSQTGPNVVVSTYNNLIALRNSILSGKIKDFVFERANGAGSADDPQFFYWKNAGTSIWFRATNTWTSGAITSQTWDWSNDAGASYASMHAADAITYDAAKNITAATIGSSFIIVALEALAKVRKAITDLAAHIALTGASVHGLASMSTQANTAVNIDGGTIDGTPIGSAVRAAAEFTRRQEHLHAGGVSRASGRLGERIELPHYQRHQRLDVLQRAGDRHDREPRARHVQFQQHHLSGGGHVGPGRQTQYCGARCRVPDHARWWHHRVRRGGLAGRLMLKGIGARLRNAVTLVITSTQTGTYNLFAAAGYPGSLLDVYLTINAGVVLEAGLTGTGFPAGSTITIVNNGRIAGTGGYGGPGAGVNNSPYSFIVPSAPGAGGHAIETNVSTIIDNTGGEIFGGGGGGGSGTAHRSPAGGPYTNYAAAGGGGGGQGYNNAAGGAGGFAPAFHFGNSGAAGSSAGPGAPGSSYVPAGASGDGGGWGGAGGTGGYGDWEYGDAYLGGAAGNAVKTNGGGVTWLGGNNGTQVKGLAV